MKRILLVTVNLLLFAGMMYVEPQQAASRSVYPNELSDFQLYVKYLSPLRPYVSDTAEVIQVLGSDQGRTVDGWRFWPLYVGDDGPSKGRLAEVEVIPQKQVSMRGAKFPAAFAHHIGTVSEINVTCDVYTDKDGLQYWLYADDSKVAKKGDLMHIIYGASDEVGKKSAVEIRR